MAATVDWVVASVRLPEPIEPDDLRQALAVLPSDIIRLKGFVGDRSGGCWLVQGVGDRRELHRVDAQTAGEPSSWGIVAIATPAMTVVELDANLIALRSARSSEAD